MRFLNPALLLGAAALAIPIIIHLFHKSRFQIVKWGAMHLLEAVIRTNQRQHSGSSRVILLIMRARRFPCFSRSAWRGLSGRARKSSFG